MIRRTALKLLGGIPFLSFLKENELEWDHKETNWTLEDNEPYRYYFGGFATGKTTRLVNDAVNWLMMNPGTNGLFVVNHFGQIKHSILDILRKNWPDNSIFSHHSRTLNLPNKSSLRFTPQDLIASDLYSMYDALWTDQITTEKRKLIQNTPYYTRVQHVISMNEAHNLHDRLGLKPILISNKAYASYDNLMMLEKSVRDKLAVPKLWGFR